MGKKQKSTKTDKKAETIAARILKQKQELVIELRKQPVLQIACTRIGVSRSTAYRWIKDDAIFADVFQESRREGKDFISDMAESQIIKKIGDGNLVASIFWLKTHRKEEFTEHMKHDHGISVDNTWHDLTPEEDKQRAAALIHMFAPMFSFKMTPKDLKEAIRREHERIDRRVKESEAHKERVRKALESDLEGK
ncbi:MAG: hypothetical protein UW46_C0004G0034 [Candidatus Yanofskybacteria bacterium GW2011_GWF1_44_227]|uniref:Homeodomain phBC6A51-type domain-containing protein n=1 Tax=Candidatus Yanofskybacteria bacterium GW2011_GWE2_40_11 TaxID=1619033 RepID=A0A0G0T0A8_9BACT|nr:MAG: hypothetical protein UT75_C0007G0008 [Candidatus Yanofskybacteria bacterium GW2011_GWE2_40_11]KKT15644.1 MAG: hypothetical protein UV97_C0004G0060 [Candidatus Yanofskybacteria bacterium GW2011_GWF2_43_596]KKT53307.1 MAG: hypothetical protein UW46_C0004G0034 [Candidatus Yanofskybacteria bacterium GW2011_GWF1_44_227]OGN35939.1 MAG: hypothetical protein A2207_02665 [Candidatus Yanofskybacteria bacterium RIFOXYA1_FULL_44_17]OGN36459.1 MAG: hypothetical protein A2241_01820 [Candidatus Yanofs